MGQGSKGSCPVTPQGPGLDGPRRLSVTKIFVAHYEAVRSGSTRRRASFSLPVSGLRARRDQRHVCAQKCHLGFTPTGRSSLEFIGTVAKLYQGSLSTTLCPI